MPVVVFFEGQFDASPRAFDVPWLDLVGVLRGAAREAPCTPAGSGLASECVGKDCPNKAAGMAFSPAVYRAGTTRGKDNVERLTYLVGDLDHLSRAGLAEVKAKLAGLEYLIYSTHGHLRGGPDDMALRVVFPLTRPVEAVDWRRFWLSFVEGLGLPFDKNPKSTASLFFLPLRPAGSEFVFEHVEGIPVPVDAVLEAAGPQEAVVVPTAPVAGATFTSIDGEARAALLQEGRRAGTLVPGGTYGPQGLGRRMTCYNTGRRLGGLAAAGRFPIDEALEWIESLVEPPLTPRGECVKALHDGARAGAAAPLTEDETIEGVGTGAPRYPVEAWFWPSMEAIARGAPDMTAPSPPALVAAPGQIVVEGIHNASMIRHKLDHPSLLNSIKKDKHDKIINCGANVSIILRHLFYGEFRFNLLTKSVDASRSVFRTEGPDTLPNAVANYLTLDNTIGRVMGLTTTAALVAGELLAVASENAFNPLREYLTGLTWDGKPRLDTWLERYANAAVTDDSGTDVTGYVRMVGVRWILSAAARALYPGCKADCVLVLEGTQGFKKSTLFDILGGEWFNDTPLVIGDKDANLGAGSNWIHELAELASLKKTESEKQKAFLSSRTDSFRVPYGRVVQTFPRACIFAGTTNEEAYLHDQTGNRRYWCVKVTARCDASALKRDRDQLWAEAVARLAVASRADWARPDDHEQGPGGERWWLEPDEQVVANDVAEERMGVGIVEGYTEAIEKFLKNENVAQETCFTLNTVASRIDIPAERQTPVVMRDISRAMRRLHFEPFGMARPRKWKRSALP